MARAFRLSVLLLLLVLLPGAASAQEPAPPTETIAAVRIDADGDGVPDRLGERVTIEGVAYSSAGDYYGNSVLAFVLEGEAGIAFYAPSTEWAFSAGDRLRVTGTIAHFAGLTQIHPERMEVLGRGTLPEPIELPRRGGELEAFEGRLIEVTGRVGYVGENAGGWTLTIVPDGDWDHAPRVFTHRDRPEPLSLAHFAVGDRVRMVGPLSQFSRVSRRQGYQIHMRGAEDLQVIGLSVSTQRTMAIALGFAVLPLLVGFLILRRQVRVRTAGLRESEARYRSLVDQGSGAVVVHADGRLLFANRHAAGLLDLCESPEPDALSDLLTEDAFEAFIGSGEEEDTDPGPLTLSTRDGRTLELLVDRRRIDFDGRAAEQIWFQDVSDLNRQARERRQFETRLQEKARLESLGVLAGGIAHDFNNLMGAVIGNADLILESDGVAPDHREDLEEIVRAAERASDLTQQILGFSGQTRFALEPIDLSRLVREVASLARSSIPGAVRIELSLDDPCFVEGDAAQLTQVVLNLLTNAAEALPEDADERVVELELVSIPDPASDARSVRLTVRDSGKGMDDETRTRIFEPFFTTKGSGRGLGLASARGILQALRGDIQVCSTPGVGTEMVVTLPCCADLPDVAAGKAPDGSGPAAAEVPFTHGARILVVDDEGPVRRLAENALSRAGHEVRSVPGGREALNVFAAGAWEPELVLLDITMPGMSGLDVLGELRVTHPRVPVILSSGYAATEATRIADRWTEFLPKPYRVSELVERVARTLEHARPEAEEPAGV